MDLPLTADEGCISAVVMLRLIFCYITLQSMLAVPQHEKRGPRLYAFRTAAVKAVFGPSRDVKGL